MAKQAARSELSSLDLIDETSSSSAENQEEEEEEQQQQANIPTRRDSIKNYVTNVLHRHGRNDEEQMDLTKTEIKIGRRTTIPRSYENVSAFRQYHSNAEGTVRTDAQRRQDEDSTSDDENDIRDQSSTEQSGDLYDLVGELNLDPNPLIEERDGGEKIYKQKVYLRQLQPPTPQPVEIQVQEVLIQSQTKKSPLHVRVGQREPRTPSPILIKSTPPQPPPTESDQPIIYNKYVPPPKQPPQQIIIHRYPDLPPKPRPIVVEQWLPYKPAPKRIIKHSLPREALQTPPPPHNLLVSYAKPRALIEVELVRLPIVKIDPYTYQQMSINGPEQLPQHPFFQHEQEFLSRNRPTRTTLPSNPINWRI